MIAIGSTVTGDPYIEGRTEDDILLIFNEDPLKEMSLIEKILKKSKFEERYAFSPKPKAEFGNAESKYSFSDAFRSKTLHGEDLVSQAKLPDKEKTKEIYSNGLKEVKNELYNLILNSKFWTTKKMEDKSWKQFKNLFMYLAIREYSLSGDYPKTRNEISRRLDSISIEGAFNVLHSINNQSKKEIVKCARDVIGYLDRIETTE